MSRKMLAITTTHARVVSKVKGSLLLSFLCTVGFGQEVQPNAGGDGRSWEIWCDGAVNKECIPMRDAIWSVFMLVARMPDSDGKRLLVGIAGFAEHRADSFIQYTRMAVDDVNSYGTQLVEAICAERTNIRTLAQIVAALDEMDSQFQERQETHIANISQVLTPEEERGVIEWADEMRSSSGSFDVNKALMWEAQQVDPQSILDRMCR